ncbi:hypothetical protein L2E82_27715 [Cichorium intybus]|uniref:Uncharacterized protein n=1 Tax=Cichorium intybus TaxID=13427 RepID=A0ACB9CU26_CICIN|nr:hypothetical protein L2E82_27715 [Cichorium intybus]
MPPSPSSSPFQELNGSDGLPMDESERNRAAVGRCDTEDNRTRKRLTADETETRQLAKSGNDDLGQDVNHCDTWKRRLVIRTYKVVPFTPSAGVLEWVNGTLPLGEYLTGRSVNLCFIPSKLRSTN